MEGIGLQLAVGADLREGSVIEPEDVIDRFEIDDLIRVRLEHRAEKCTRFSAFNDAQVTAKASDFFRKMDPFFGPML
jgi:hypothetical protein